MENILSNQQLSVINPDVVSKLFQIISQVLVNQAELNQKIDLLKEPHPPEIMNISEVSELTKLSVGSIYQLVHKRKIPFYKQGEKLLRFKRSEIVAWLFQNQPKSKPDPVQLAEQILSNCRKG